MNERTRLIELCINSLRAKGLVDDDRYKGRLKKELKEVDAQGEHEYFLKLHEKFRAENLIFPVNEHNNLIDFLLGLTTQFDIDKESAWVQGEMPDIDIDYIKEVRDWIKRVWAPQTFGQDMVCEIGTYGTTGIKSAVLDMARVYGVAKDEFQAVTVKMVDKYADDNGDTQELEWEDALRIYPEFAALCERYPEVASAAQMLLDRNRSGSVHAGGLVISSERLDGFVPLEVRSANKDKPNGIVCSAWTEGLNRQDLGPVGLIKFDLLVINNLMQIAVACKLIRDRHPEVAKNGISARPGQWDWSDLAYLNDPKSIEMANRGDLKCIFQFDSEGMRKMVKRGGVSNFDDLAAYSALYRPGPLNMGMDARLCKRKRGEEPYNIHPVMQKTLGPTYGVLIYQEQVMDILRLVGLIPDMHTEKVRKAISKKKVAQFIKYKDMFIQNGMKVLGCNADFLIDLWNQIEAFAEYGFNKSHAYAYTYVSARLLYLKAHYPIEFYTAMMMCEKNIDRMKDYKLDAKSFGRSIDICPVHINKSDVNFSIKDEKIYFGFSNIKGLGEEVAERIVEQQKYESFVDFLDKFGTDATPIKALTSLGVFEEPHDRIVLRKFAEYYKKQIGKQKDRQKRFEASMDQRIQELKAKLLEHVTEDDPDFEKMNDFTEEAAAIWAQRFSGIEVKVPYNYKGEVRERTVTVQKQLDDLAKKRENSIRTFNEREREGEEGCEIGLDDFNPSLITLKEEEEELFTDELVIDGKKSFPKAESQYYGFQWTHVLETSPDYEGKTIDNFLQLVDTQGVECDSVHVFINKVRHRTSKSGVEFFSIDIEDANAKQAVVNVWKDDFERWKEDWRAGNMVSIRVRPPSGGFNTFTFDSYPRHRRKFMPPKEDDPRFMVLRPQEKPPEPEAKAEATVFEFDEGVLIL